MDKRRGFTLIELLVVIAIIALLMAMLVPALEAAKERAQGVVCRANERNIMLGLMCYMDDNDGIMAWIGDDRLDRHCNGFHWTDPVTGLPMTPDREEAYWGINYLPYAKSQEIYGCPGFRDVLPELVDTGGGGDAQLINKAAFGINAYGTNRRSTEIRTPHEFVFATDHVEPRDDDDTQDMFHNGDVIGAMNLTGYREGGFRQEFYRGIFRHAITYRDDFRTGGYANILWLDGHVSRLQETTGDDVRMRWYTGD